MPGGCSASSVCAARSPRPARRSGATPPPRAAGRRGVPLGVAVAEDGVLQVGEAARVRLGREQQVVRERREVGRREAEAAGGDDQQEVARGQPKGVPPLTQHASGDLTLAVLSEAAIYRGHSQPAGQGAQASSTVSDAMVHRPQLHSPPPPRHRARGVESVRRGKFGCPMARSGGGACAWVWQVWKRDRAFGGRPLEHEKKA
eukprot:scaffold60052_cov59-Phaeocystis_antarctica.AAC.10